MQALRRAATSMVRNATGTSRSMATKSAEETWAGYFPKNPVQSAEATARNVRKEMIGFILLGPVGAGLMIYDFMYGLESHSDELIPPYPWMRMRKNAPGMPWGEDALFEYHRYVADEWPLPEGHDGKVHHH
mmetsp:Transcript_51475/g.112053  ORF Transcript_51475/g.112053 Transcript_51475/m.112053 type:complete len:131 (-) Transcript_51475:228-620(-)